MARDNYACEDLNPECKQLFARIDDRLSHIQENLDRHAEGSDERRERMNKLITDVEVIKSKFESQREFQKENESSSRWRTGIFVGIVTTVVTILINIASKVFGGK